MVNHQKPLQPQLLQILPLYTPNKRTKTMARKSSCWHEAIHLVSICRWIYKNKESKGQLSSIFPIKPLNLVHVINSWGQNQSIHAFFCISKTAFPDFCYFSLCVPFLLLSFVYSVVYRWGIMGL